MAPAAGEPAELSPTFAEIYKNYMAGFATDDRTLARWKEHPETAPEWPKFSLQKRFDNRAYVEQDWRVPPIVKRANELMARGEYREAMNLYQHVIEKYPDDMWRIAEHGVFIPTTLYCQRQLLRMPKHELEYYRTVYDPSAKPLFEKAKKHYSPLDFAHVAFRHCATSYGSLALFELGNAAIDAGNFELARHYYERIRHYHRFTTIDRDKLNLRLLNCYKRLEDEKAYAALAKTTNAGSVSKELKRYLAEVDAYERQKPPYFDQRAAPDSLSLSDFTLFEPLVPDLSHYEHTWTARREMGYRFTHPNNEVIPTVAGSNLIYKDKNIVYCRSLLTGALKWKYDEGGLVWSFERIGGGFHYVICYPYQDLTVHNGMVYTFVIKQGPSLVALDLTTGERRWAAGPIAASSTRELDDRYAARPTVGSGRVYATVVHDDIEGDAHLSSTAGVAAFAAQTGKLLWRRELCRLTPSKFTISRARRKIRIFCTQPVYKNGVVYVSTNAGVFAALDAETGDVRWITRYDQNPAVLDARSSVGRRYRFQSNTALILYGPYMLATAIDSAGRLYCLDRATGKVAWTHDARTRVIGVWKGQVIMDAHHGVVGVDARTGKKTLEVRHNIDDARWAMQVVGRDGKVHSSGFTWNGQFRDTVVDLDKKKLVAERLHWSSYVLAKQNPERIKKGLEPLRNTEPYWFAKSRMGIKLWGLPCELEIDAKRLSMKYDLAKVKAVLADAKGYQAMYDRAELHQFEDRRDEAIAQFEKLRSILPDEHGRMRIEVNRELFRLYTKQAQAAMRAGRIQEVEECVRLMGTCPTTSRQEVQTVLSMAEIFERQKRYARAGNCLRAVIRHYKPVQYPISSLVVEETEPLVKETTAVLRHLMAQSPKRFHEREFSLAGAAMLASVPNYFSLISPVEPDMKVETGQFAIDRLLRVLAQAPPAYRKAYEAAAAAAFKGQAAAEILERTIREFPGTAAGEAALDSMIAEADALPVPARNIRLWQLEELAELNGLTFPSRKKVALTQSKTALPAPLAAAYKTLTHTFEHDQSTTLRLLKRRGGREDGKELVFVGTRGERRHAVKHGIICFDLAAGATRWKKSDIRLKGKGDEPGFEEVFVHRGKLILHGWHDVFGFNLEDAEDGKRGEIAWRYRVPHDFKIEAVTPVGDVFVLSSRFATLTIHYTDGSLVWDTIEQGELYCPPVTSGTVLATARMSPSGVSFRSLFTGRLKLHLDIPGLLTARKHPVLPRGQEGLAAAFGDGLLVVTDGWDYIGIDVERAAVRWKIRIPDVDHERVPPYRFLVSGKHFFVLKQEYDVAANEMYDTASGVRLWRAKDPPQVLYSPVCDDSHVYGLNYERDVPNIRLRSYARKDGSPGQAADLGDYDGPEIFLHPEVLGDALVAVLKDRQQVYSLVAIDKKTRRVIHEIKVKGHGLWGTYGQVSYVIQGPAMALLSKDVLTYSRPQ